MVEEIVDPMSTKMAVTTFSENVENEMRRNGDLPSANLCRDMRLWWNAEDSPGVPAQERIKMRLPLRKRLLTGNKFEEFPPKGMYVNGWPSQLWEAILASIDSKAMLYSLCKNNTYNARAFSTMMNETFFSELTTQDRRGHGTISATEFATHIGAVVEQMHMRLDSDRSFTYRTSRSTVYRPVTADRAEDGPSDSPFEGSSNEMCYKEIKEIVPRDHFFDTETRKRTKGKQKEGFVSTERNAVLKGSLGVRWEKARLNESKLLPSQRMSLWKL